MTNLELIDLYHSYEKMTTKEFTELFNSLTIDSRKELLNYLSDLPDTKIYKTFVSDIRGQAVQNYWNHERELILNGKSTRN